MSKQPDRIMNLIVSEARRAGADPVAMLATAQVESSLNPRALGDGGTSYGLFQHHVGGAGGSTHEQARRFYDPTTSARERARHFAKMKIRGGAGAAALQRPADPAGYAQKVDAQIARIRKTGIPGGGAGTLNAPVTTMGSGMRQTEDTGGGAPSLGQNMLINMLFSNDPLMASLMSMQGSRNEAQAEPQYGGQAHAPTSAAVPGKAGDKGVGGSYKWLQKVGHNKFGLRNDPGDGQTTGGRHTAGSNHYKGRAVDFGDAKNTPEQLKRYAEYMRKKHGKNIKELYYSPLGYSIKNGQVLKGHSIPGHDDHLHIAI